MSENDAKKWLIWQDSWQIYLPALKHIPQPKFDVPTTNAVHQADLFLPHDTVGHGWGWKTYKYALTVVNVASHFKEAKPLTSKDTAEVAGAFQKIYKHGPLKWPELLRWTRDTNSFTNIQCGWGDIHQDQAIMERFYRTLVECLFEHQHASKMHLPEDQRSF